MDRENIQSQLEAFAEAGLGGVHIIPIYGAKGFEEQFLDFLSEEWMAMVDFTLQEAKKQGLGVDLTLGTGWPYGGPWIGPEFSAKKLVVQQIPLKHSRKIHLDMGQMERQYDLSHVLSVWASRQGKQVDLTPHLKKDILSHKLPGPDWGYKKLGKWSNGQHRGERARSWITLT